MSNFIGTDDDGMPVTLGSLIGKPVKLPCSKCAELEKENTKLNIYIDHVHAMEDLYQEQQDKLRGVVEKMNDHDSMGGHYANRYLKAIEMLEEILKD